jgi:hypothetical protein
MKDSVRIFEGAREHTGIDGGATVVRLPVGTAATAGPEHAPHPVYSLDGLMALALAVSRLEVPE